MTESTEVKIGSPTVVRAYLALPNQVLGAGWNVVRLDTIQPGHDRLNEFDVATYRFTPKRAGYYFFHAQVEAIAVVGLGWGFDVEITLNGLFGRAHASENFRGIGAFDYLNLSALFYVTPNDFVNLIVVGFLAPNIVTVISGYNATFFEAFRVR